MRLGDLRLVENFRYMDREQQRRVIGLAALGLVVLLILLVLAVRSCGRAAETTDARPADADTQAVAQVREAMLSVVARLTGENPDKTVQDAVQRAAQEKAPGLAPSSVDKSPLKFDPDAKHWIDPRSTPVTTVLVVAPAPKSFRARNVTLLGVARGGVQIEITAENTPDWLPSAVLGPAQ